MKWIEVLFMLCIKVTLILLFVVTKGIELIFNAINTVLQKSVER